MNMVRFVANVVQLLKPRRRWFQFSLGTLFIGVTLFGLWLGHWVDPVHRLEQQLSDENEDIRHDAARKLGCLGRQAKGAEASLAAALEDESAEVRMAAA
jgi:hypothetical protein